MVFEVDENVDGQTHTKVPVPVSLTEVKRVMVEVVLGRVTTREYSMLSTFLFVFLSFFFLHIKSIRNQIINSKRFCLFVDNFNFIEVLPKVREPP